MTTTGDAKMAIPDDLLAALRKAGAHLEELVEKSRTGVLCRFKWYRHEGIIKTEYLWHQGALTPGGLEPYSPRGVSAKFQAAQGDAALLAMSLGYNVGAIIAGARLSLWCLDLPWEEQSTPSIHVVNMEHDVPAMLDVIHLSRGVQIHPELLRFAGRRLKRGETLPVWGLRLEESSAHEEIHIGGILGAAMAECGLTGVEPRMAFDRMILNKGCDHYLWRTPAAQPDSALLLGTHRTHRQKAPVAARKVYPVAICPL